MIRLRDVFMVSVIATLSLAFSPVYAGSNATETITRAEQDLNSAIQSGAVGIDKLLELAKKKLDEGQNDEAKRLLRSCRGLPSWGYSKPGGRNRQNRFTDLTGQS